MPLLIDANNLMFALADVGIDVGREGLCRLLEPRVRAGEQVCVVFDGAAPPEGLSKQIALSGVEPIFCPNGPADAAILERIAADTAPRRLTVVSTDRQIRKAARARRCVVTTSERFAAEIERRAAAPPPDPPVEPPEKRKGLSEREETEAWLREFGLDE